MRCLALLLVVVVAGCSGTRGASDANPWRTAKLGSVYESRTITRMQKPFEHTTESTTKQTLLSRTTAEATVKLELSEGASTSTQNVTIALADARAPMPHDGSTITRSEETCTVPAGTFQCTRTSVELGATSSMVTWTAKRVPVPLRSIVTNDTMTITTELVAAR